MDYFCPILNYDCSKISFNSLLTNWCYFNDWTESAINPFWISMFMYILNKQILVENESRITRFICLQSILSDWMVCDMERIPNKMKHLSETLSVRELFKFICKLCLCVCFVFVLFLFRPSSIVCLYVGCAFVLMCQLLLWAILKWIRRHQHIPISACKCYKDRTFRSMCLNSEKIKANHS